MNAFLEMDVLIENKFAVVIKVLPSLPIRRHQSQVFLLGNCFKFDNIVNVKLFHVLAEKMESSPIHSTKQNQPDIKHGKETMLKNENAKKK